MKTIFSILFTLFTLVGCAQQETILKQDNFRPFRKSLLQLSYKSLTEHNMSDVVMEDCIFKGFVMAVIDIDNKGKATFELNYASSSFFKDVFYEPLKNVDTSSLDKGKRYLVPISYTGYRSPSIKLKCTNVEKQHQNPIIVNNLEHIDYVFKTFDFFWVTPIP